MKSLMFVFFILLCLAKSAKILGVFPTPAPSHYFLGSALMRGLAERGHDVTVISSFGEKNPPKNGTYRDIITTGRYEDMQERMKAINMFEKRGTNPFFHVFKHAMMADLSEKVLAHENVQKFINSGETFDVVIVEQFLNDAQKAFSTHFKAPLITFSTVGVNFWTNPLVGNPSPPSYISEVMLNLPIPMSFCNRLYNSFFTLYEYGVYYLYVFPKQNKIIKKYFPNGPELDEVLYNSSIMLLNSHPSTNNPVPYVPNMIDIGGFHVKPPKRLPKDLQDFLDSAKDGVIYFSMGSHLKSAQLPPQQRDAIISAFSKLKEKVLWKWEDDSLPNQPANVKLEKWLPQQDILAHPNVKLFITHGGLLSTTETIYHGVPVLAIPIFGDQFMNAQTVVNNGFGLSLPYKELHEENLSAKINELLTNPKYKDNAKLRSQLFHDRPVKPMDLATYWVEYVIKHRGAPHLRVGALDIPWYQYHLLDVIAFSGIISLVALAFIICMTKKICRIFSSMKNHTDKPRMKIKNH